MGLNFTYCDNGQCATAPNNNGNIRSQQITGQGITQTYLYDKANRLNLGLRNAADREPGERRQHQ
jgi:hypothetical protein